MISVATAERLAALGPALEVEHAGRRGRASLHSMACTCGRGEGAHVHHFVESPLLAALVPGRDVELRLEEGASTLVVEDV